MGTSKWRLTDASRVAPKDAEIAPFLEPRVDQRNVEGPSRPACAGIMLFTQRDAPGIGTAPSVHFRCVSTSPQVEGSGGSAMPPAVVRV